jgi:hypothetical protein
MRVRIFHADEDAGLAGLLGFARRYQHHFALPRGHLQAMNAALMHDAQPLGKSKRLAQPFDRFVHVVIGQHWNHRAWRRRTILDHRITLRIADR